MFVPPPPSLVVAELFGVSSSDLVRLGLAGARVLPVVIVVPAFGLRGLPAAGRALFALVLGVAVAPALVPLATNAEPWPLALLEQFVRGLPVALGAASVLWAATTAGNLVDAVRGVAESQFFEFLDDGTTPIGNLLSLLAAVSFLRLGGPARLLAALANPDLEVSAPLLGAVHTLLRSIDLGLAIAVPLVVVAVVLDATVLLMARATAAEDLGAALAPLRGLALLLALALFLTPISDRLTEQIHLALRAVSRR